MRIPEYRDVAIVGGGPAGLAAAIAARREGFTVAVLEHARPPIDKACGEGLMPDGVDALRALGITVAGFPFRGIRFVGDGRSAAADFPSGFGLGFRRTAFHGLLSAHAAAVGVDVFWGMGATGLSERGVLTGEGELACRWIVGADGSRSRVRGWAGIGVRRKSPPRFGFRRHYEVAPWSDYVEVHWGQGRQIYVTPVSAGQVCVALVSSDPHCRLEHALSAFPILQARLNGAAAGTPERGAITGSCRMERVASGRVALIGDASGTVDAITGEGLCLAFRQALALAASLRSGSLDDYASTHPGIVSRARTMANLLLLMDRHSWIRRHALSALSGYPALFRGLLSAHVGKLEPA